MEIITIEVSPVFQNCRILIDAQSARAVVVDPGGSVDEILEVLRSRKVICEEIWLTHSHFDHCGGVAALRRITGARLFAHPGERVFRENVLRSLANWKFSEDGYENCPEPDVEISGGEILLFAEKKFLVLPTPGHSPGHLCFHCPADRFVLSGDALFQGSIGRTDLPGGDHQELIQSIIAQLLSLSDDTKVLSGHGADTTIGRERTTNPFLVEALHV